MSTAMNIDEMKSAWGQLDARLARIESQQDELLALRRRAMHDNKTAAGAKALRPLLAGQVLQAMFGVALALMAVLFWVPRADHGVQFIVYGATVQAYAIWLIASAGHELSLLRKIRFSTAVLEMQTQLATLRRWRARNGWVFVYAGCFIWIPVMLMLFASVGADVWTHKPQVVGWFLVSGAVTAAAVFLGFRLAARRPSWAASLQANAAGQSVRNAELALGDIEAFKAEAP